MTNNLPHFPRKPCHADTIKTVPGADSRFTIRRHLEGYPYGMSSAGQATPRYVWHLLLDGKVVDSSDRRMPLVEWARSAGVDGYSEPVLATSSP